MSRRTIFLTVSAVVVVAVIIAANEVVLPFVLALVVAYVFTPVVARLERSKVPRVLAILLTYAAFLGSMIGFGWLVAPRLGQEIMGLRGELPHLVHKARSELLPRLAELRGPPPPEEDPEREGAPSAVRLIPGNNGTYDLYIGRGFEVKPIGDGAYRIDQADSPARPGDEGSIVGHAFSRMIDYGQKNTLELIRIGRTIVAAVSRAFFVFFITLMLAAYLMLTRERVLAFFRALVPRPDQPSFDDLCARIDVGLSGVVRGQLLICLVNGVLSAIGFWMFGLKYWPILSIVAAVMSLVPIFGSILSSVPIVAIALTQSFGTAVAVLAWIVGIHQLEANFLNPKIIGDAAKIHPVLVVFSLVVGEHLFKLPGALLAVPCMSIAQSFFLHFRRVAYGPDAPPDSFRPPAQ